ncbi:type IV toxin-antitoxin system AbiEi family antitoxin domain-containing protein [Microbacterium sp. MM2322]|uniref:type IV toxin-antitoxin system AbiEi family antitoxin domain-containing protein n=1 Tax=Microbacterium sp. MM2322 TaxID=3157631 RepID=UPI0032D58DF4
MRVTDAVAQGGGIVRSAVLRRQGFSDRAVRVAVDAGELVRPRRGWVATLRSDPALRAAAAAGVVLSCATQAQRLGLWVLRADAVHVAASAHSGSVRIEDPNTVVHWAEPIVPRAPDALVDPIENVLALTASCLPFEEALAIWESALERGMVQLPVLRRLPFPGRAREVLAQATPFAGSGLESFIPPRLAWLRVHIVPQAWIAGHRVDFLIGDRLVLQIDGGTHVGAQRDGDNAHDAELMLLGYHVVRVGYAQVVHRWHVVQDTITRAVAQGLHLAEG